MNNESGLWQKHAALAHALLRMTLGLDICMHGIVRWVSGLGRFAGSLQAMFHGSPLPPWSVAGFGYALPMLETAVGVAILIGFQTHRALVAGMALMMILIFGSSLRQDWQIVGLQLVYSIAYAILLATAWIDRFSLDSIVSGTPGKNL